MANDRRAIEAKKLKMASEGLRTARRRANAGAIVVSALLVVAIGLGVMDLSARRPGSPLSPSYAPLSIPGLPNLTGSQEVRKFSGIAELSAFLSQASASSQSSSNFRSFGGELMATGAMKSADSLGAPAPAASDYSQTNVQVEGVDEGDFVKNDGSYIYAISGGDLVIISAYDASNISLVSRTPLRPPASDMQSYYYYYGSGGRALFLDKDKVVVFVDGSERSYYFQKYDIVPQETYRPVTEVRIYDVSDRSRPALERNYTVTGGYYESRLIGDKAYVVTQEGTGYFPYVNEPLVLEGARGVALRPDVYYFDNPEGNYNFNTIASFSLSDGSLVDSKTFMLGYADTLMVSQRNIYVAYERARPWCGWWRGCLFYGGGAEYDRDRFYAVILPRLTGDIRSRIEAITSGSGTEDEKWQDITIALSGFYESLASDESLRAQYNSALSGITVALEEYDTNKAVGDAKTVVHRIAIDDGRISYSAKGEVPGRLLNQFSMDEDSDGRLRLATTVDVWMRKQVQYNNVYVLGADMATVGKLENVSRDERIYSARFLGDKLFLVTYYQVDPLFVIDLADPASPRILGELKIPGYSDYLHPVDSTHLIGIGKETKQDEYGRELVQGVKVALFDVSDYSNPRLSDSVEIGQRGSDSAALHDHKAFLFSKSKSLLVIPVTEITGSEQIGPYDYKYGVWQGAYAFRVNSTSLSLLGKVEHSSSSEPYYYWNYDAAVQRALYMDDVLFTLSPRFVKASQIADGLPTIRTVALLQEQQNRDYPHPLPMVAEAGGASGAPTVK